MPNLLGKTLFSGESVDGVIRFAHSAESAADGKGGVRLQHNAGDGVDIAEVDLDRGLVLKIKNNSFLLNKNRTFAPISRLEAVHFRGM